MADGVQVGISATSADFDLSATAEISGTQIESLSGTINGVAIAGLSSFDFANNQLYEISYLRGFTSYGVDRDGLAFTDIHGNIYQYYDTNQYPEGGISEGGVVVSEYPVSPESTNFTASSGSFYCFCSGTILATKLGPKTIEELALGDRMLVVSGSERAVIWISCRIINDPDPEQCPIRIRAGSFGSDLPDRDLFLSPGHPVLVGDHLVPIMCLINGTTIARHPVESVTYWHVELDQHDILLAEGLPCESYFDMGSRRWFGGSDAPLHDPEFVSADMLGRCRPVAIDGPLVEAERLRLDAVFEASLIKPCAWPTGLRNRITSDC